MRGDRIESTHAPSLNLSHTQTHTQLDKYEKRKFLFLWFSRMKKQREQRDDREGDEEYFHSGKIFFISTLTQETLERDVKSKVYASLSLQIKVLAMEVLKLR